MTRKIDRDVVVTRFQIREGSVSDADRLAELGRRIFNATFAADNSAEDVALYLAQAFSAEQQAAELRDPEMQTLLGEIDGELIAYAQLHAGRAPSCVSGRSPREVKRFYVDHPWHGRGIAQLLMESLLRAASTLRADTLWLGVWERNTRAIAFYRKHGFEHVGEHGFVLGTQQQTDWVMARGITYTSEQRDSGDV